MKTALALLLLLPLSRAAMRAQESNPQDSKPQVVVSRDPIYQATAKTFAVESGTRIPLVLVNSVSTKVSKEGDKVYLQTSFPIATAGRIVIPQGSYVTGTVTQVKRPGRVKGRGELYVRFDTLMLPNGVQRDFRGTVSGVDADQNNQLKGSEGKIEGDSSKGKDIGTIAEPGAQGATIGGITGGAKGAGIGAGIGSAVGLTAVLLTRGPDLRLPRGTALEMELDRRLIFTQDEVNFLGSAPPPPIPAPPASAAPERGGFGSGRAWPQ